jgi:GH24 family phage-related lysozyme (muramidase)
MTMSEAFTKTMMLAEGVRYRGYQDHKGIWTIACGHNVEKGPPLTPAVVAAILKDDLAYVRAGLHQRAPWIMDLPQKRQEVFIELAFWLGENGLFNFKRMMTAAIEGNWHVAASELCDSAIFRDPQTRNRTSRLARGLEG